MKDSQEANKNTDLASLLKNNSRNESDSSAIAELKEKIQIY